MAAAARTAAALTTLALLPGCASDPSADPPAGQPAAEPAQLSAVSVYGRHAAVRGRVDVRIANHGSTPVEIAGYRVEHPLFEPVPVLERTSTLPPDGRARIVPVPFGAPRCGADDAAGARVVVGLRTDGDVRDVAVPLADGEPGLVRAHRLACAADAVTAAVALDLAAGEVGDDLVLRTALVLQRRGAGEVAVTELGSTILFTVDAPPAAPLVALPAGSASGQVAVQVRATRCEAHALTESKRSSVFPAFVTVDGGEPALVQVAVTPPARAALQQLLDRTCGPFG